MRNHLIRLTLRLLRKTRLLTVFNFFLTSIDGKFRIPIIKGLGFDHFFEKEEWLLIALKKWMTEYCENKYFIDVGANIGQTLLKVKSVDPGCRYIGFEPNPNCVYYLLELLNANQLKDATIYPIGLANHSGIMDLQFYSVSATDTSASLVPGFRSSPTGSLKVPVCDLDEAGISDNTVAGIVKIDVEGGELDVMKGLKKFLIRDRPLVICEVLPAYSMKNTSRLARQKELGAFLHSMNYLLASIGTQGNLESITKFEVHDDISRVNYLFYPAEKSLIHY